MITTITKRNGKIEAFKQEKIVHAIFKAASACGGSDYERAEVKKSGLAHEFRTTFCPELEAEDIPCIILDF